LSEPVRTYAALRAAIAARRKELGLTQLALDEIAGVPTGYVGKLECGVRCLGDMSFEVMLAALGLEIVVRPRANENTSA
jgi:Helix-turn-helix